jgi:hypothetical protein
MTDAKLTHAIAELREVVRCRCNEAYRDRGLKDPHCECDSADAVKVVADRIKALTEQLTAARDDAKEAEAYADELEKDQVDLCRQLIAAEDKLAKVLNHIRKMQGYVQEYLEPGPYVVKHGKGETLHEPHPHQDEAYAYFMRQQMREAVLNDLIHMLDGPEERATLAELEGEKT